MDPNATVRRYAEDEIEITCDAWIALRRCGRSHNKPFCANGHRAAASGKAS